MTDPEIRLSILRDENELHIFIDQLANLTPHEIADLVEDISGILRTLPDKPLKFISADDPELQVDNSPSYDVNTRYTMPQDFWN